MSFFEGLKEEFQNHREKRREQKERIDQLNEEAEVERDRIFKEEYQKNIKEVMIAKAKKEAAEASGLKKMRAANRLRNLQEKDPQKIGGRLAKFSEFTRNNMAKTEERKKRTEEMRKIAREDREKGFGQRVPLQTRKPFQRS